MGDVALGSCQMMTWLWRTTRRCTVYSIWINRRRQVRFYTYLLLRSGTTERCVNISWINKGSKWADLMSFLHRSIPSSIKGAELCVSSLSLTTEHSYSEALGHSAWIDGGRITPLRWRQLHCINQSGAPLRSAIQTQKGRPSPRLKSDSHGPNGDDVW